MDLTEAEDIKRGGKNTQNYTKMIFMTQIKWWCNHSPRARHPRMQSQVDLKNHHYEKTYYRWWISSWAISNAKRWCCESAAFNMPAIWKTQQWPQYWRSSIFIPIPKKGNAKECSIYCTIALISHVSKVMLKILQDRIQQYITKNFQKFKLDLEKAEEPETKLPTFVRS